MYSAREFGSMISDSVRTGAFLRAIEQTVRGGDVVVDLGAGTGVLSLLACKAGADHVYAVETNPLVRSGPALAMANGFEDRITFVCGDALDFTPDRQVNVVIGDVRGSLPTVSGLDLYRDAAERYLAADARTVPQRDEIFVAPLTEPEAYTRYVEEPWASNEIELDLTPGLQEATATPLNAKLRTSDGLMEPRTWAVFDYLEHEVSFASHTFQWQVYEPTTLHFLALWFDTTLAPGVQFSNAPGGGGPTVYGQILLPLEMTLSAEPGDTIGVRLRSNPGYTVWSWNTAVHRGGERIASLQQSSLAAMDIDAIRKHRDGVSP